MDLRVHLLLLGVIPVACAGGERNTGLSEAREAPVQIVTDAARYSPGDRIGLRVSNRGSDTLVWNPCVRSLERQDGTRWSAAAEADRICTLEGWLLPPSRTVAARTELSTGVTPGEYRLRYRFSRSSPGPEVEQTSNSFSVGR